MQQKAAHVRWLTLEHLGHQIVDDMTVIAGERADEPRGIRAPGKRESGKVQTGNPPLGASMQQLNIVLGQVQPEHLVEQMVRLNNPET